MPTKDAIGMGTPVHTAAARAAEENPRLVAVARWIGANRQKALALASVLVIAAGLVAWNSLSARQTEQAAGVRLNSARLAFESRNYPLAASELSQIVENYSGTRAAHEAHILLARVRLQQGQAQQAIELLKRYAPNADAAFRAQAFGLLGTAYENAGHPKEAADAYQQAAEAAQLPFLRAQFLADAGRAWVAAGDSAKAVQAYRAVLAESDSAAMLMGAEAKVRLAELTKGASAAAK
jgi:predicted negative regulator of RcsB-dependent stress response